MVNSLKIISAILAIYGAGFLTGSIVKWSPIPTQGTKTSDPSAFQSSGDPDASSADQMKDHDDDKRREWDKSRDRGGRGRRGPGRGWSPDPEKMANDFVQSLDRKLELEPSQETRLLQVFQESHERMKNLREELDPKMRAEFHRVHEFILETLNESQKAAYLKDLETNRWNRGRRPPPPPDKKHDDQGKPSPPPSC